MDRMNYVKKFIKENNNGIDQKIITMYICGDLRSYAEDKRCVEKLEKEGYLKVNSCTIDNIGVSIDAIYLKEL